jgi:N-ethylmaleimide reductase
VSADGGAGGLFAPGILSRFTVPHRIVMAPLTRNRAGTDGVPSALAVDYYGQRASAALIVSESTSVSALAVGYPRTPGLFTRAQVEGWRAVTEAVHARGGRIFAQLCHNGRVSHPSFHAGAPPVAPSAMVPPGQAMTPDGLQPFHMPRALTTAEVREAVEQFAAAASSALAAGFDGVEVHGASGFLVDQFLRDGANHRTDCYGGSIEKRARFLLEVVEAVGERCGFDRVGVRLSPLSHVNGMFDSTPWETFAFAAARLNAAGLAYLHLMRRNDAIGTPQDFRIEDLRRYYRGVLVMNGGYDRADGDKAIRTGQADFISYGTAFLANPDLPERLRREAPLNAPDKATFYTGGARGYLDYPPLESCGTAPGP